MPDAPQPRQAVLKMSPYSPPTSGRAGKLRLDFNENTVGCSPRVLEYLRTRLTEEQFSVYPEYEAARAAVAAYFGVPEACFTLSNGTDEAIQVLVNTYVDAGDEAILLRPSFAMYRFYAEVAGAAIREIDYHAADLGFPTEELLSAIGPETKAILISNPNNPTGTGASLPVVETILQKAAHAVVLIDEAYYEFSGITALPLLDRYPNLFVSRTFSKAFGMAALRVGSLFSQSANVRLLRKAQSPYSVNMLAAIAIRAALEDREYVAAYTRQALDAREILYRGLASLGIRYFPSQANFVLFHAGDRARAIRDQLRDRGVLVRDRSYELPGCVRVTAGTPEQARIFLKALEEIWM
jgi:histidinol-phosphate aminotransferase